MGSWKERKGNRVSVDVGNSDDDDDDFEPTNINFSSPYTSGSRKKKVASKKLQRNKKNKPKRSQESASRKSNKVHEEKENVSFIINRRKRGMDCLGRVSCHIVHYLRNVTQGTHPPVWQDQALNSPVMKTTSQLRIHKRYSGFDRRTTAMAWHPTNPNVVAVGSKGGDIIMWNYELDGDNPRITIKGLGPGGSIQALQFDERNNGCKAYTVSIDGTLALHDFLLKNRRTFLETEDLDHWYTSLDVSVQGGVMIIGDNKGYVNLLTLDGEQLWQEKLHKQKVTHIEFCRSMPWCLVTTSVDRSLKIWDIRNMKTRNSYVVNHMHRKPINSAYFSRTDGGRIVTTDQESEIRVYSCPSFNLSHVIPHPHRQFQHLTPIKATWHPLRDIIVVGRYPDPVFPGYVSNEPRTIDFFNAATGELMYQHMDKGYSDKIVSLNMFNNTGDRLLSAAGMFVWVWKPRFDHQKSNSCKGSKDSDSDGDSGDENDNTRKKLTRRKSTNVVEKEMKFAVNKMKIGKNKK
ncbi:DNA damage-binding protein 2-like isoform X2 [Panulirus ornatus]|uniref:DNA damage-binding protein 2-like isoform X2 n=1 Tax=Panulirus ornatus TaxID=150431 RepID=UPI003A84DC09